MRHDPPLIGRRFHVQAGRPKIGGHTVEINPPAAGQETSRDTSEEFKRIAFFEIEHPSCLHQEPALFVGFVRTAAEVMFPERVRLAVGEAGHLVEVGLQERLHLPALQMHPVVPAIVGLTEDRITDRHQLVVIGNEESGRGLVRINDLLEDEVDRSEQ